MVLVIVFVSVYFILASAFKDYTGYDECFLPFVIVTGIITFGIVGLAGWVSKKTKKDWLNWVIIVGVLLFLSNWATQNKSPKEFQSAPPLPTPEAANQYDPYESQRATVRSSMTEQAQDEEMLGYPEVDPDTMQMSCSDGCTHYVDGCDIKGNISFDTGEKIYHVPGQEFYTNTTIDPTYGERWFCTEAEAISNGWRKSYK